MKIMTMIWPTSMARHRSARQLRRKKHITAVATRTSIIAIAMRTRKRITAIAMRKRRIIAIVMRKRRIIVTDTEAKSLIITMSITTTTDAIWQRS